MDFVKHAPWLVPLFCVAGVALTVTLRPPQHNTGHLADDTVGRKLINTGRN